MARKKRRRTWGTGSLFERNGRWWIRWREGGRRRSKSFASRELAEQVLAKIVRDVAAGEAGLPKDYRDVPTLGELAEGWLGRRDKTHRSARDDRSRWRCHLKAAFGHMKPAEVDSAKLRLFIETKRAAGLSPTSVGHLIRLLSTWFSDLLEQGHVVANPISALPRATRRLFKSTYDTTATPFLQKPEHIRAVFLRLPEPISVAFAVGALAGLRTSEVLGLSWEDVDLGNRRICVRRQAHRGKLGPLKDNESRTVPLLTALAPILSAWKLKTGGVGFLFKPPLASRGGRPDLGQPPQFIRPQTLAKHLRKALEACGLPPMAWYHATRHTFASQFVLGGGSIELLSKILGHASITTTEHYSHLKPDLYAAKAFDAIVVDLAAPAGEVVSLRPAPTDSVPTGPTMATTQTVDAEAKIA
jgi:integrase